MSVEVIDIIVISIILLLCLLFIYYRVKKLLTNGDANQCNGCADQSCSSKKNRYKGESPKDGLSCKITENPK